MTAAAYETLSLEQLDAIEQRLYDALQRPNLANRVQVTQWYAVVARAIAAAYGWTVAA